MAKSSDKNQDFSSYNALPISDSPIQSIDNIEQMLNQAQYLIDNNLVPNSFKTPQQIVTAVAMGRNLDMDAITSLNSFDVIQGTPTIKSKLIPGVLSRKGVALQVIKDYEPVYLTRKVPKKDSEGKLLLDDDGNIQYYKNDDGTYLTDDTEIDRITTVRVHRYYPNIGVVVNDVSFNLAIAKASGWYPDKENWRKLTPYMMMARCISRVARIAAGDYMHGLYDEYEILDTLNVNYDVDTETGEVTIKD